MTGIFCFFCVMKWKPVEIILLVTRLLGVLFILHSTLCFALLEKYNLQGIGYDSAYIFYWRCCVACCVVFILTEFCIVLGYSGTRHAQKCHQMCAASTFGYSMCTFFGKNVHGQYHWVLNVNKNALKRVWPVPGRCWTRSKHEAGAS